MPPTLLGKTNYYFIENGNYYFGALVKKTNIINIFA
jgi:hypothetical protein